MEEKPSHLVFYVNGKQVTEQNADPEMTLLTYLRNQLRLTGTKLGCAEGGCGACTVMISKFDRKLQKIRHYTVNACLAPVCSMHGLAVTTVEGIGSTKTKLHPVQERIAKSHGSQCGFCTPGIVMSMYTLLRNHPQPTTAQMESAFEGNLCRCTGYRPILDGFRTFTKEFNCGMGENCCKNNVNRSQEQNGWQEDETDTVSLENGTSLYAPYDPSQEIIFPNKLQMTDEYDTTSLIFRNDRAVWYRPTTLQELLHLKSKFPHAKLVIGNTEIGVEVKFKNQVYPVFIAVTHIPELSTVQATQDGIILGASVTLATMEHTLKDRIKELPAYKTRVYAAIVEMLRWFAGQQIRNVAAIAGNIITASPISDLNPVFLAAGCKLKLTSTGGTREVKIDEHFFKGYRKTALNPDEVVENLYIPHTSQNEYFGSYKQAQRREDDIAIVNAGLRVQFEEKSTVIKDISMAFGGMAPITVMAVKTMHGLIGKSWDESMLQEACKLLCEELLLAPGTPGGMEPYRNTLTTSFFFKFYLTVLQQLQEQSLEQDGVPQNYQSATSVYQRGSSCGIQVYEEPVSGQPMIDPVGRSLPHLSAAKQACGEATYCDDIPKYKDELYMGLVLSTKAHAKILNVDTKEALLLPGVHGYVDHKDVPGSNLTGVSVKDEEVFATEKVTCQGQVIGAVVAENQMIAQRAAKLVKVTYQELDPIITIEEAIKAGSMYPKICSIKQGDMDAAFTQCDHVLEGHIKIGGQEHFYLETTAVIAVPKEDGEMEIFSSTQNPTELQLTTAETLGVPGNRIVCRVKRLGGGFGGKETRYKSVTIPCAVAAHKYQLPVRIMLDRDEDMVIMGTRHPFLGKYKVGFTSEGKFVALFAELFANCGNSVDLSPAVTERAVFHIDNTYKIPNINVTGYMCKTNIPSNTAFRGFGGPQGMMVMEHIMSEIAVKLNISAEQIRAKNIYEENDTTHFNQRLVKCNIKRCWEECIKQSDLNQRKAEVEKFNRENRWKKRGISVIPTKFGISYTLLCLNQAGALVHIYKDGSVLVTHGGAEMGQGLHTKMIQVASRALKIPMELIYISETSTNTVPNTSPTAASVSSDINGMAVKNACEILMERLDPIIRSDPKGTWKTWISKAYWERISLSATGFYKTPNIGYNWEKNEGNPFSYFTFGAACSEVEIDCLTGDHTVLRTDIVMDVGCSLNPAIDIGQIEGGFMQGYGLFTIEDHKYSPSGYLYTRGPGSYKIPGFGDIPIKLNVSLLKGSVNDRAVYSSKAVGEPPLFLAASVFYAIKNAIASARADSGVTGHFQLDSPATAERIRMACVDQFTQKFPAAEPGSYKPWIVQL